MTTNANIGPDGFKAYLNDYFVETGTLGGESIKKALQDGFKFARSIEFDIKNFRFCTAELAQYPQVQLYHGSSQTQLWDMIKDITSTITFWLDAHIYPPLPDAKNCPLFEELEQIKRHPIKTHTILIDDMHCAGTESFDGITKEELIAKILEINPAYTISYIAGGKHGECPNNIMVAVVPSTL